MKSHLRSWFYAGVVVAAAGMVMVAPAAIAKPATQGTIYNGITMAQLKKMLASAGGSVTEANGGALRVADGPLVFLTQCPPDENGTCYEISIMRTFSNIRPTLAAVNKWNYTTKIPEASLDDMGALHLQFWLTTVGLSDQLLADSIGWFEGAWKAQDFDTFWGPFVVTAPST